MDPSVEGQQGIRFQVSLGLQGSHEHTGTIRAICAIQNKTFINFGRSKSSHFEWPNTKIINIEMI